MMIIIACIIGYLLGSIPFALVIGKVFYNTDIRQFGSGNLGGTNAGRVLGKKAGMAVIACDALKCFIPVGIFSLFSAEASIWCGLSVCIGHCYPIFANFKGGKAAASMFGFLLAISCFTMHNIGYFLFAFAVFMLTLYCSKMVSLSSMCATTASTLSLIVMQASLSICLASAGLSVLIIYRHIPNIKRIREGTENKVKWL